MPSLKIAVLIFLAIFLAEVPRDTKDKTSDSIKSGSDANQAPANQSSPPVPQKTPQENKTQSGKVTPTNEEQAIRITSIPKVSVESNKDVYDKVLVFATCLLVLVGGFQIYYLWRTIGAVQSQAMAMMEADCALCCIVWENFIHLNPEAPNGVLAHCFNWTFTNAGKSPAFVEKVACRFIVIKSLDELPMEPDYPKPKDLAAESEPVLAGQTYERRIYAPLETSLSYQEMEAQHRDKKCLLYAYGFVKYLDVYGREQETRFGLLYDSAPTPTREVDRFRMAGPRAYNRYKRPQGKRQAN